MLCGVCSRWVRSRQEAMVSSSGSRWRKGVFVVVLSLSPGLHHSLGGLLWNPASCFKRRLVSRCSEQPGRTGTYSWEDKSCTLHAVA